MKASSLDVKRMDHLGLIAAFCKEINLEEFINQQIPKTSHRSKISNGTLLLAMILNGLGFVSRTLHLYPDFFQKSQLSDYLEQVFYLVILMMMEWNVF